MRASNVTSTVTVAPSRLRIGASVSVTRLARNGQSCRKSITARMEKDGRKEDVLGKAHPPRASCQDHKQEQRGSARLRHNSPRQVHRCVITRRQRR